MEYETNNENNLSGWIKLFRSIQNHWIWQNSNELKAWITILLEVQHKAEPQKISIRNNILICNRGESLKSLETWTKLLKFNNISKTRRFLNKLQNENMIRIKSERKTTRLTVVNYDVYQTERISNESQMNLKRILNESQMTTDKNDKNDKNVKNVKNRGVFTPPTIREITDYCTERKNLVNPNKFFDFYEAKGWYIGKNKMKDWRAAVRTWEKESGLKNVKPIETIPEIKQDFILLKIDDVFKTPDGKEWIKTTDTHLTDKMGTTCITINDFSLKYDKIKYLWGFYD